MSIYHYDESIRKWLLQIIRVFSNFTVQYGLDGNGNQLYSRVPVIWGDSSFSAATIARLNTENMMPSTPLISLYISNLKFERDRTQAPTFTDTKGVRTRQYDANTGAYLPAQANAYNVKRFMPVPYRLEVKLDIVTSNTQQKLQLLEQILPLFNPAMEIQKTDNYLDWESLSYLEITDTSFSNRSIPVGQGPDSSYDICTLSFFAPIWLSLPAQVSKMGVIFKVINNIEGYNDRYLKDLVFNTRQVVTFNNYGIYVTDGQIRILNQGVTTITNANINNTLYGEPLDWSGILGAYGKLAPGVSQVGLTYSDNINEILGTVTIDPTDSTILLYNVNANTLPSNTLPMINAIVNPQIVAPGYGLANANVGQSYIITANIGSTTGNSSGTGGTYISQTPTGTLDGNNTQFGLSFSSIDPNTLYVTWNGVTLAPGDDYSLSGQNLSLGVAPSSSDSLYAYYLINNTTFNDGFMNVIPSGAIDSSNRIFTLPSIPVPASGLNFFYNGQLLVPGTDYTLVGTSVTLSFAPNPTDVVLAIYRTAFASKDFIYTDGIVPTGTVDGTNRVFTLPSTPVMLHLFYGGVMLTPGPDYTLAGNTITYTFAPTIGSSQIAYYATSNYAVGSWPYGTPNSHANASTNDIITYDGTHWVVTFDASTNTGNIAFVFDSGNGLQYQWNGNAWVNGWEGPYDAAHWRLIL